MSAWLSLVILNRTWAGQSRQISTERSAWIGQPTRDSSALTLHSLTWTGQPGHGSHDRSVVTGQQGQLSLDRSSWQVSLDRSAWIEQIGHVSMVREILMYCRCNRYSPKQTYSYICWVPTEQALIGWQIILVSSHWADSLQNLFLRVILGQHHVAFTSKMISIPGSAQKKWYIPSEQCVRQLTRKQCISICKQELRSQGTDEKALTIFNKYDYHFQLSDYRNYRNSSNCHFQIIAV